MGFFMLCCACRCCCVVVLLFVLLVVVVLVGVVFMLQDGALARVCVNGCHYGKDFSESVPMHRGLAADICH